MRGPAPLRPAVEAAQEASAGSDEASIVYANCAEVKANGAAPIRVGDLGWDRKSIKTPPAWMSPPQDATLTSWRCAAASPGGAGVTCWAWS